MISEEDAVSSSQAACGYRWGGRCGFGAKINLKIYVLTWIRTLSNELGIYIRVEDRMKRAAFFVAEWRGRNFLPRMSSTNKGWGRLKRGMLVKRLITRTRPT
jgi:hypothetical protein